MRKIIIDTDIGGDIDDTWALVFFLTNNMFDVKMISVTGGNIDYQVKLVSKILTLLNHTEIPIVRGKPNPNNQITPQIRWLEDFDMDSYDGVILDDYYQAYKKVIEDNNDVSIASLAPFTSLVQVLPLLKVYNIPVIAMAGSIYKGYFDSNEISPECNIVTDIEASKQMLTNQLNITLLPLDVCGNIYINDSYYLEIKESNNIQSKIVMENYKVWNEDYEGGARKSDFDVSSSILYDMVVGFYMIFPQCFDLMRLNLYVDEQGYTRIGGNNLVYVTTRVHKLDVMIMAASEQLSTKFERNKRMFKMGIPSRYQMNYVLTKCNALLTTTEYGWEAKRHGAHYGPSKRDYYILHFIESGKGFYIVGDKRYDLEKGDCFLVPPYIQTYYEADKEEPWKYYWIGFDGLESKGLLEKTGLLKNDVYSIKVANYQSAIEKIKDLTLLDDKAIEYRSLGCLYNILADMMIVSPISDDDNVEHIEKAIKYINANYNRPINIQDVSNKIGIERTYLYRLFMNKMNISPQEYLVNLRIENAKVLICNTNKSIKEIASLVGYTNYISFIKTFKEKVMCSPKEYGLTNKK